MGTAGSYDPFAIEKPVLRLGSHGEWTLGDITESRRKNLARLHGDFESIANEDDVSIERVAQVAGDLVEAACENSQGLKDIIVDLCDDAKHGDNALGVRAIIGLVEFVGEWLRGESDAGNG